MNKFLTILTIVFNVIGSAFWLDIYMGSRSKFIPLIIVILCMYNVISTSLEVIKPCKEVKK